MAPGWHRGTAALELGAADVGAGGRAAEVATSTGRRVHGARTGLRRGDDRRRSARDQAAALSADGVAVGRSRHRPARRRRRTPLRGCAIDFAGDHGCAPDARDRGRRLAARDRLRRRRAEGQVAATVSDRVSRPGLGDDLDAPRRCGRTGPTCRPSFDRGRRGKRDAERAPPRPARRRPRLPRRRRPTRPGTAARQLRVSGSAADVRRQVAGADGGEPAAQAARRRRTAPRGATADGDSAYGATGGGRGRARGPRPGAGTRRRLMPVAGAPRRVRRRADRSAVPRLTVDYGTAAAVRRSADRRPRCGVAVAADRRSSRGRARALGAAGTSTRRHRRRGRLRAAAAAPGPRAGSPSPSTAAAGSRRPRALARAAGPRRGQPRGDADRARAPANRCASAAAFAPAPAPIPARGKLVTIQYLERASGRWRPALVTRTDAAAASTPATASATSPARRGSACGRRRSRKRGWPYAPGSSAPVTVEVRGDQPRWAIL